MNSVQQYGWRRAGYVMPHWGLSGSSQQGDAKAVAGSLQQMADASMKLGIPIAAAVLEVGSALANIVSLFGPNADNTITTGWVNQMEADVMVPNLKAWQSLAPEEKTPAAQAYALEVFSQGWNQIVQLCSNIQLGSAGTSCIADRQNGACKWKDSSGKCFNWFSGYRDPIANDPAVAANVAAAKVAAQSSTPGAPTDTSTPGSAGGSNTSSTGSATVPSSSTFLYGGLALLGVALLFAMGGD